jgi:hypothetical protein
VNTFADDLKPETIRDLLAGFWAETLELNPTRRGLALAMPQTLPDGWQLVVELEDELPAGVKITDRGRTIRWLASQGLNVDADSVVRHLGSICRECDLERDGLELFQWFPKGIEALQIHLFAEALVNVAHLHYLRDLKPRSVDMPDRTLRKVFTDHGTEAVRGKTLDGQTRKQVRVDYFVEQQAPLAFQIVRQHGRILSTMERWGFRWRDLRERTPSLRPAMIYDPHHQEIDPESCAIGEDVCDLFCSYEETDRIHEFLGEEASA